MTKSSPLPFKKTYYFSLPDKDKRNGIIGEQVNLWKKPNTKEVSAYDKDSAAGMGWIGYITDELLAHHIGNDGKYDAILTYKDDEHALIDVTLYELDQKKVQEINKNNEAATITCLIIIVVLIVVVIGYCA